MTLDSIWQAQAASRAAAARAGRQRGVIVYKLGPKRSEVDNLRLSLRLLMHHHNRAFGYPILVAHDELMDTGVSEDLRRVVADAATLQCAKLSAEPSSSMLS